MYNIPLLDDDDDLHYSQNNKYDGFIFQKGDTVKPNYNSVDLAEVELAESSEMVRHLKFILAISTSQTMLGFQLTETDWDTLSL